MRSGSLTPKRCRRCREGEPSVRFAPLSRRVCMGCKAASAPRPRPEPPPRKPRSGSCPAHLDWVRAHRCVVRGPRCVAAVHAHHVRTRSGAGTGLKPADAWAVPLCALHHHEVHTMGAHSFEAHYGVELRGAAERLARLSPHLPEDPGHAS